MATKEFAPRTKEELLKLFGHVAEYAAEYVSSHYDLETKVVEFKPPHELRQVFDFSLPVGEGQKLDADLTVYDKVIRDVMRYSVRTGCPRYQNQLWSGTDVANIVAEMVSAFMNSSTYTYEVAPVFSLMEIEALENLKKIFGLEPSADSILVPGGSLSNLQGMLCARFHAVESVRLKGNEGAKFVCFTSPHSHYTIKRGASIMGVGMHNVRHVQIDKAGRMRPDKLDEAITQAKEEGCIPFFVNATAGTTVLGLIEDISALQQVCEKHGVWLHVDAALAGPLMFSEEHKGKLAGIEKADSFCVCFHKMLNLNQQCSVFFSKHENILKRTNASNADYLFHADDTAPFDLGDKTLLCGRHQDSFKLWLSWRVHGTAGWGRRVETCLRMAKYFAEEIKKRSHAFELISYPETTTCSFYCLPECIRDMPPGKARNRLAGEVVRIIRRRMQIAGVHLINYNPLHGDKPDFEFLPNFFRIVFANPEQDEELSQRVLDHFEELMKGITLEEVEEMCKAVENGNGH